LHRETESVRVDGASRSGLYFRGLMTNGHYNRVGIKARDGPQDARDHRFAGDFVEHLGALRTHPSTKSGGKNHGGERSWHRSDQASREANSRSQVFFLNNASSFARPLSAGETDFAEAYAILEDDFTTAMKTVHR
jgi:hypothetical protein